MAWTTEGINAIKEGTAWETLYLQCRDGANCQGCQRSGLSCLWYVATAD